MIPELPEIPSALGVLSAMITPAVLILASSSLILATSARLGRVVDRTRTLSERFVELARADPDAELVRGERVMLFDQLDRATRRARLLQRAMTRLYLALSAFLATSVVLGVDAIVRQRYAWLVALLGLAGVGLLFWASVLLIVESRLTLAAVDSEMDFVRRLGEHHAPSGLPERRPARRWPFRRT